MLKLVTMPPAFGMRNVSPFCLKAEMLLASLDLPYELALQHSSLRACTKRVQEAVGVWGRR